MNLSQFTGTEHWYRHPFSKVTYTDGVKYFAETAGAYWFLDIAVCLPMEYPGEDFMSIALDVTDGKAKLTVDDGNENVLMTKDIEPTDCPAGKYCFFLTNNVLMLTSEY